MSSSAGIFGKHQKEKEKEKEKEEKEKEKQKVPEPKLPERISYTSTGFILLPGLDGVKDKYDVSDPEEKCVVEPFNQTLERGSEASYIVFSPTSPTKAFRVRFGDLPYGVSVVGMSEQERDQQTGERQFAFSIRADDRANLGNYGVTVMYDSQGLLSGTHTAACSFSLRVQ